MQQGYTLLEVVITIVIILIATLLVSSAFPVVRAQQGLLRAERQLQSLIRDVQQRASNEIRDQECLDLVGDELENQRLCSDLGLHLLGNQITLFADTSDDDIFTSTDYVFDTQTLATPVSSVNEHSLLFEATPPTISLISNGATLPPDETIDLTLQSENTTKDFLIYAYGQLEPQ